MNINVKCPQCQSDFLTNDDHDYARCPHCSFVFLVAFNIRKERVSAFDPSFKQKLYVFQRNRLKKMSIIFNSVFTIVIGILIAMLVIIPSKVDTIIPYITIPPVIAFMILSIVFFNLKIVKLIKYLDKNQKSRV